MPTSTKPTDEDNDKGGTDDAVAPPPQPPAEAAADGGGDGGGGGSAEEEEAPAGSPNASDDEDEPAKEDEAPADPTADDDDDGDDEEGAEKEEAAAADDATAGDAGGKDDDDDEEEGGDGSGGRSAAEAKDPPEKRGDGGGDKERDVETSKCGCRKSTCVLLYCACFGEGKACSYDCSCKNCKNPKGVNPRSPQTKADDLKTIRAKKKARKKAAKKIAKMADFPALLMLTVSPGRLGLTLTIVPEGGARIASIDPACTFRSQVVVGDRIVTIDGKKVVTLDDLKVGFSRVRKFGIIKKNITKGEAKEGAAKAKAWDGRAAAKAMEAKVRETVKRDAARKVKPLTIPSDLKPSDPVRKQTYPYLTELNATGTDRWSEHKREDILTEVLQFDKKNKINTQAKMGSCRYQLLLLPLKRRDTVNQREFDNKCFHQYNQSTKVFDKFLDSWASYVDGTREDAVNMISYWIAKNYPTQYVKNFGLATKKVEKAAGPPPPVLPPDFVSYDGTNDIRWNTRYGQLKKYREENGDCKVFTKTDLGKWVCQQRSMRVNNSKALTPRRIQLFDEIGFLWCGLPEGWTRNAKGGDPRQNRAIAAKLVYPDLTFREALRLGGFEEEELNAVRDQKHMWRTGYVYFKDIITKKVEHYETARRSGSRLKIENLINILNGDDEDKYEQVFEENSSLLPDYLAAAEERRRNGIVEQRPKSRSNSKKRSRHDEDDAAVAGGAMSDDGDEQEQSPRKRRYVEYDVGGQEQQPSQQMPDDFQAQVGYDHDGANAQQVAQNLHSWRQQGNYWR